MAIDIYSQNILGDVGHCFVWHESKAVLNNLYYYIAVAWVT